VAVGVGTLALDGDGIRRLQQRRLLRLFAEAGRVPLHAARLRGAGIDPRDPAVRRDPAAALALLPVLDKATLRAAGNAALRDGRLDPRWHSSTSSGSTGEPFRMYYDPRAWFLLKYLIKARTRLAAGMSLHDRSAVLDAFSPDHPDRSLLARLGRVRRFSVLAPAAETARALARFRPEGLYGLPSGLLAIAEALPPDSDWSPGHLFTSGELLSGAVRAALERAFGGRVTNIYGSSETKEIAWECSAGRLHVNADVVHVETVDAAGTPVPPGEEGDVVATLLVNRAMPLLRYRIGDRGVLGTEPCRCGLALPALGVVTGRETDVLELAGGRRLSPYALTLALEQVPGLLRYQVRQLAADRLRITAVAAPGIQAGTIAEQFSNALARGGAGGLEVEVELVPTIAAVPGKKFRVVHTLKAAS
jgi:phenylacetate-CoA ligase